MTSGPTSTVIKVTGDSGTVTPDEAIALGLITTELVINSLKHGFPTGGEGEISVTYESSDVQWKLSVGDDGVGLSATQIANREGLGTSIVESLVAQLDASVKRNSSPHGTTVSIAHPLAFAKTA